MKEKPGPSPALVETLTASIELAGITRRFGDKVAVSDLSLRIGPGEIFGLLGPNGAGKTTTIKMLSGLLRPTSGTAKLCGLDVWEQPEGVKRQLGYIPDDPFIYELLTGREFLYLVANLFGLAGPLLDRQIEDLIGRFDAGEWIDRRAEGYSQGQRTKTAIARALVHDPRNVLLDEPTNGLDVMTTRAMRSFLRDLRTEGRCVLFSSHIMQEVAALCDRIVVIANGRVMADGTPEGIREQTGMANLEDAFVKVIGSEEGLFA
jgi:sodium transport system ATP-binding protein